MEIIYLSKLQGGIILSLTNPISSSEVGTLWLTYQEKTLIMRILEYFMKKADDDEARNILGVCGRS